MTCYESLLVHAREGGCLIFGLGGKGPRSSRSNLCDEGIALVYGPTDILFVHGRATPYHDQFTRSIGMPHSPQITLSSRMRCSANFRKTALESVGLELSRRILSVSD